MHFRVHTIKDTATILLYQGICTAFMLIIFALFGQFRLDVLLGGLTGGALAVANFFFLSLFAGIAADKAQNQDTAGAKKLLQLSYIGRMAGIALVLSLCAGTGAFHPLALALPLALTRPILTALHLQNEKGVANP